MKFQAGYITTKSGSFLGHYSKWVTDWKTGEKTRIQRAYKIGKLSEMTKTEARQKLQERVASELGTTADGRATLKWFIEHRWKPMREGTWRESTKQTNEELLKMIYARFGALPIEDVDGVELQSWLNKLAKERSGSVVKHLRIFLRSVMLEATEEDYVRKNPARMLRVPKLKTIKRRYLSTEHVKALLKAAQWSPSDTALLSLILVTGLRPSELFALRWENFNSTKATLTIAETVYRGKLRPYTKTTEEGETDRLTIFVPDAASLALAKWHSVSEHKADDDFIFPAPEGGFWHKENYQRRVLVDLALVAEIEHVNFQVLRRTVATHAQHLGSPKDISVILRHSKVQTAQENYVQMIESSVKETAEKLADKMLEQ